MRMPEKAATPGEVANRERSRKGAFSEMCGRHGWGWRSGLAAFTIALVASAVAAGGPAGPTPGGTLTLGIRQEPSTTDPHASANGVSQRVLAQLYDGLVYETPDGVYHPWLATRWTIGPDGKTYTLALR